MPEVSVGDVLERKVPAVILVGAPGTGKSAVAGALGRTLGLPVAESDSVAEHLLGRPVSALMIDDPEGALEALNEAAVEVLRAGGSGADAVVTLSASAPLDPRVGEALNDAKQLDVPVVVLTAALSTLVRRNGLNAPQPPGLGTPRAWFRSHLKTLEDAYLLIGDYWCDTDGCDPEACALQIAENLGLPNEGGQGD